MLHTHVTVHARESYAGTKTKDFSFGETTHRDVDLDVEYCIPLA